MKAQQIVTFGDSENDVEMPGNGWNCLCDGKCDDKAKAVATALAPITARRRLSNLGKLVRKRRMKWQYSY